MPCREVIYSAGSEYVQDFSDANNTAFIEPILDSIGRAEVVESLYIPWIRITMTWLLAEMLILEMQTLTQ
ncbi:MAG: hypothetical protein J6D15_00115 [Clostridia bacterium]|nr:hypothetical protein [Clostridia bacterium]